MANANTVNSLPFNLTANSTSTETAVAAVSGGTTRAVLGMRPDIAGATYFDGRPFKLRVVAQGVASGAGNFVVNTYWNSTSNTNLTTFTNDVLIIGSGNQALASKSGIVFMEAICLWDSTLQQISAFWNEAAGLAGLVTTPAIIKTSAAVTATNPVTATGVGTLNLVQFFVTTSISANGTSAKLLEFSIDTI